MKKNLTEKTLNSLLSGSHPWFLNRDNITSLLGRLQALEILTLNMKDKTTQLEI